MKEFETPEEAATKTADAADICDFWAGEFEKSPKPNCHRMALGLRVSARALRGVAEGIQSPKKNPDDSAME